MCGAKHLDRFMGGNSHLRYLVQTTGTKWNGVLSAGKQFNKKQNKGMQKNGLLLLVKRSRTNVKRRKICRERKKKLI